MMGMMKMMVSDIALLPVDHTTIIVAFSVDVWLSVVVLRQ